MGVKNNSTSYGADKQLIESKLAVKELNIF